MLIDLRKVPGLGMRGVLHLGAHLAEEADLYYDFGVRKVYWVEGNPDLRDTLEKQLGRYTGNKVIIGLVTDQDGVMRDFNVSNYESMSSSVFEFGTHSEFSPDTVWVEKKQLRTITVDTLSKRHDFRGINFLNMDLQGAELLALKGATKFLDQIDYIYTEVNLDDVYVNCAKADEVVAFLNDHGFRVMMLQWDGHGWGDALFRRVR